MVLLTFYLQQQHGRFQEMGTRIELQYSMMASFIVRKNLVSRVKDMMNAKVCFTAQAAQNIRDFFDNGQITFVPVAIPPTDSPKLYYLDKMRHYA